MDNGTKKQADNVEFLAWRNGRWEPWVPSDEINDNPSTMDGQDPESGKLGDVTISREAYRQHFHPIPLQSEEEVDRIRGELERDAAEQRYFDRMYFDRMGAGEFLPEDSPPENHELSQTEILAGTDADGVIRMPGQDEDGMINGRFL